MLKKLFPVFIILLAAGAIYAYQNPSILSTLNINLPIPKGEKPISSPTTEIVFTNNKTPTKDIGSVLSATSNRITESAKNIYDKVTNEQEEALINKTVDNISKQVKDLPQEQVDKVKYQFCKDIIEQYEAQENVTEESEQ